MASPELDDNQLKALELKDAGNKLFQEAKFAEAKMEYTRSIELDQLNAVVHSNRAFCELRLENYGLAIADAEMAIAIDGTYVKAYYRLGSAYMALGKVKEAEKQFKKVCKMKPKDPDARAKLKACEKELKRIAFEKAIQTPDAVPLAEEFDWQSVEVESSYTGPKAEGGIDESFVVDMMAHMKAQKTLHIKYVYQILITVYNILKKLPSLVDLPIAEGGHFNVCGDTHGQFYDLLNIFQIGGNPSPNNPFLFNGDFVDRGSFSVEVVITLLAWKCCYPDALNMTRGNHETCNMNKIYGFEGEVKAKYNESIYNLFCEVFRWLPLGAVIQKRVMVVHGGLFSKDGVKLDQLRQINRNREPADEGLMCEMLWSDPQPAPGRAPSKRGVGLSFGPDVTHAFLDDNKLDMLVRSHEVKDAGYEVEAGGRLITIFSAPNYCDQMGNKGAYLKFDHSCKWEAVQYSAVPHPPVRPMAYANNMSMFGL